ncbi:MAG: calcium-binding protein, partial [Pseudomonadota bacterium]
MTTYSLSGFAAVFDMVADTILSVEDASLNFVAFDGASPSLRYSYLGTGLTVSTQSFGTDSLNISGKLELLNASVLGNQEVFDITWDANGVTRNTTVLAWWLDDTDLDGPSSVRAVFGMYTLDGDTLPPMPTIGYFARFLLTQIDDDSYGTVTGDIGPDQVIALSDLSNVAVTEVDEAIGSDSADVFQAGNGADTLLGKGGDDSLSGQNGDDHLTGGAGRDTLEGGNGTDTASYLDEVGASGVIVSLETGEATDSHGDQDTLIGIEQVRGTFNGDTIIGDTGANWIWGYGGADLLQGGGDKDTLTGGAGADTIMGGEGKDKLDYEPDGGENGI